ncbi:MAG: hypothetical protein MJE68_26465 [Proteobacteria bacterium]|nr:hypothetical protein [Pseudomonadota bacterium]
MISLTVTGMGFEYIALLILAMLANKKPLQETLFIEEKQERKKIGKAKYPRLKI